jgi:hypothetical protein
MEDKATLAKARQLVKEMFDEEAAVKGILRFAMHLQDKMPDLRRLDKILMESDQNSFDLWCSIAAKILREEKPIPRKLALFAADVLDQKLKRPTRRGPNPYDNFKRDFCTAWAVMEVSRQFGLPEYTNNELSHKVTAAELVADTMSLNIHVVHHAIRRFGA